MSQVYLNLNNQQAGPYDIPTVNGMLTSGQITAETLVWIQGMANWEPVSSNTFASLGIQQTPQPTSSAVPKPAASSAQKQMPAQQVKSTPNSNQNSSSSALRYIPNRSGDRRSFFLL